MTRPLIYLTVLLSLGFSLTTVSAQTHTRTLVLSKAACDHIGISCYWADNVCTLRVDSTFGHPWECRGTSCLRREDPETGCSASQCCILARKADWVCSKFLDSIAFTNIMTYIKPACDPLLDFPTCAFPAE